MLDPVAIEEAGAWAESARRDNERRRREARAAWYAHEVHMQELHARLAAEHEQRAQALLEDQNEGSR